MTRPHALGNLGAREVLAEVDRQAEILDPGHIRRCTAEQGVLSPADSHPYVTQAVHDGIPAGATCIVSRPGDGRLLRLEFPDGRVVWTHGYAAGIEWKLERLSAEYAERVAAEDYQKGGG